MSLLSDRELALTEGVPEIDRTISRTRDNLSVIGGEGYRQDILCVSVEVSGGGAGVKIPKAECAIP